MTMHATVKVAKAKDTLSLATQALYMEAEEVKAAASHLGYTCAEIPSKEKKALCKACDQEATDLRYVWTVENQKLVEKAIKIAARDNQRVEVRDGIGDGDQCLIDIVQDDAMKKHYKNIFKGSL